MTKLIYCKKIKRRIAGIREQQPYPGSLGEQIFNTMSQQAWDMWLSHQTMLINEYRLNMLDKQARKFLETEMEKFFFGQGSEKPEGFIDPSK